MNPNEGKRACGHPQCNPNGCRFDPDFYKERPDPLAESEANGLHPFFVDLLKSYDNPAAKAIFGVKEKSCRATPAEVIGTRFRP